MPDDLMGLHAAVAVREPDEQHMGFLRVLAHVLDGLDLQHQTVVGDLEAPEGPLLGNLSQESPQDGGAVLGEGRPQEEVEGLLKGDSVGWPEIKRE